MARALVAILAALALLGAGGTAQAADYSPRHAAHELATDYIAPLVRPDTKHVRTRTFPCRQVEPRWWACRVRVEGVTTCRAIVHVRDPGGDFYTGWVPRLRCAR